MKKATLKDRLRYRFDTFMSRGTIALVGALFAVTFLVVLAGSLILVIARLRPEGSTESLTVAEALWQVTMRTIDTGTVAGWPDPSLFASQRSLSRHPVGGGHAGQRRHDRGRRGHDQRGG